MRVLLDTNILIHREAATVIRDDIGGLFRWLDRIGAEKCIHPASVGELQGHQDPQVVQSFAIKIQSYHQLLTTAPDSEAITAIRATDQTPNDRIDTDLILEVEAGRVDLLLSEDRGVHRKAEILGISDRVYRINAFLEKVIRENPDLVDYSVLGVKKVYFGEVDIADSFFDSFRQDYPGFDNWFNRKADEAAYVCTSEDGKILAFLFLKLEGVDEPYPDISPQFQPANRLKIGTLKVVLNGFKLGERFLKIVFDNAMVRSSDEIYVTIFERTPGQRQLIGLLEGWGFSRYGTKVSAGGDEGVWVRKMRHAASEGNPAMTFPFICRSARKFVVPIYPDFHTELLPDSILNTESPMDFLEQRPNRNAIRKAYISRSYFRELRSGDIIVFYRTRSGAGPAHYTSVATTIGVVEKVALNLPDFESFRRACGRVTVFSDQELLRYWNWSRSNRPFVVQFLNSYTLPRRPNLSEMKEQGVLSEAPRGFEPMSNEAFGRLLELANAQNCPLVDKA